MKKRQFSTGSKIALAVLVILMIAVIAVAAVLIVNNVNSANEQVENTENTTIVLDSEDDSEEQTTEENSTEASSKNSSTKSDSSKSSNSSSSSSSSKSSTKSDSGSSSSDSSSSSSSKSSSSSSAISKVQPSTNATHASEQVCTINGTKCYVGDTVTLTVNIKTPKILENFQGYTEFDTEYLKFKSAKANVNGLVNNDGSTIYYNGSDISTGFDFTSTGTIYTATFKVKKAGKTSISNTIQVLTDMNDNAVDVDDCKVTVKIYD